LILFYIGCQVGAFLRVAGLEVGTGGAAPDTLGFGAGVQPAKDSRAADAGLVVVEDGGLFHGGLLSFPPQCFFDPGLKLVEENVFGDVVHGVVHAEGDFIDVVSGDFDGVVLAVFGIVIVTVENDHVLLADGRTTINLCPKAGGVAVFCDFSDDVVAVVSVSKFVHIGSPFLIPFAVFKGDIVLVVMDVDHVAVGVVEGDCIFPAVIAMLVEAIAVSYKEVSFVPDRVSGGLLVLVNLVAEYIRIKANDLVCVNHVQFSFVI
jgi:hypothetical protein